MALTKVQARARTLEMLDGTGSSRWDVTPNGYVDRAIGLAQLREWRGLLDLNPDARSSWVTVANSGTGRYPKASLSTGSGDSANRLYRIRAVKRDDILYEFGLLSEHPRPSLDTSYTWMEEGDNLLLLPLHTSASVDVLVSHLPVPQHELSLESSAFVFPVQFEDLPLLEAAAFLLSKGGAEVDAARELKRYAAELRADAMASLRLNAMPLVFRPVDSHQSWGMQ